jgi:CDP-glucose 4,6-dehydratase
MPESLSGFYRGKKVLVTGHTGFKGGWLALWLRLMEAQVIGLALPPQTKPSLFESASVDKDIRSCLGDIRDQKVVVRVFAEHRPEIVIHNAAQPLVRRSYRDPIETYATNVMGTVHVLDAARQTSSVRSVLVVTSDKCYENREWSQAYVEENALGGHDPYSSSKACAELVTAAYRRSFFTAQQRVSVASARAGNVIGGGDWSDDRLIPDIVKGLTSNLPVVIRRPDSVRPWQHVLEPLRGYLTLARLLWERGQEFASSWNFGPRDQDTITVEKLANLFVKGWGSGEMTIQPDTFAPHEAQILRLNCSKSRLKLGWQPVLSLAQGLELTVDWYRRFYQNPAVARSVTEEQIKGYMRAITA